MKQTKIRQQVEEIIKQRTLLEPSDKLIVELQPLVTFPDVAGLFYSDQNYDYISNRIIDYENRKKDNFSKKELINMVTKILNVSEKEYEIDNLLLIVENAVKKDISEYIYYSNEDLTAEQIIEKALCGE
ncbi:hypothetical protein ACFX4Y_10960 [Priestia sp. YIM B13446]|uniref:hypothetical protein n=1 Tax=Priestia TaxID=2800373 RepID=UPI00048C26CD|nr:hypothetical protein [Priestia megaterium]RCX25037.1 hypothetical protein DEU47_10350 [Bacillus sp. AG236]TCN11096.1 hypothetical protein EV581_104495 [Bacillus sp. BK006]MCP1446934.1 hypothetical protein [Priestia megaterium]MDC7721614.1 hypothetical protein [Priestia megaterium]MED4063123.1 hypothetical protein [Priestia megaterium]